MFRKLAIIVALLLFALPSQKASAASCTYKGASFVDNEIDVTPGRGYGNITTTTIATNTVISKPYVVAETMDDYSNIGYNGVDSRNNTICPTKQQENGTYACENWPSIGLTIYGPSPFIATGNPDSSNINNFITLFSLWADKTNVLRFQVPMQNTDDLEYSSATPPFWSSTLTGPDSGGCYKAVYAQLNGLGQADVVDDNSTVPATVLDNDANWCNSTGPSTTKCNTIGRGNENGIIRVCDSNGVCGPYQVSGIAGNNTRGHCVVWGLQAYDEYSNDNTSSCEGSTYPP